MNKRLKRLICAVLNSEDNAGCSKDLTVVSSLACKNLRKFIEAINNQELRKNYPEVKENKLEDSYRRAGIKQGE